MCVKCVSAYATNLTEKGATRANELLGDASGESRWPAAGVVERRQLSPELFRYTTTQYGHTLEYVSRNPDLKLRPCVFTMPGHLGLSFADHQTGIVYAQKRYPLYDINLLEQQGTGVHVMTFQDVPTADAYIADVQAKAVEAMFAGGGELPTIEVDMDNVYKSSDWRPVGYGPVIDGTKAPAAEHNDV